MTEYVAFEDNSDEDNAMQKMLKYVADHFGEGYDKYKENNICFELHRKGHKL